MERDSDLPGPIDYLLIAVFGGIEIWAQPPRLLGARITIDREATRTESERWKAPLTSVPAATRWPNLPPPIHDPCTRYHFLALPSDGKGKGRPFTITVNRRTGRIDWFHTDRHVFAKERQPDGVAIVALLTLPIALPLHLYNRYLRRKERTWGLSRHAKSILDGIGPELTSEARAELERAFRLEWEDDQRDEKIPTFDEARARLSSLRQECTNGRDWSVEEAVPVRNYIWIDADGRGVAHGREVGPTGACSVTISGMLFQGEEARRLLDCYSERTHLTTEPEDA